RPARSRRTYRSVDRGAGRAACQSRRDERAPGRRGSGRAARAARHRRVGARAVSRPRAQRAPLLRPHDRTSPGDGGPDSLMLDSASKASFHLLAQSGVLKKLASRYGMRRRASFARRFIAGETIAEAIDAARTLERRGLTLTLDHLGESVANL